MRYTILHPQCGKKIIMPLVSKLSCAGVACPPVWSWSLTGRGKGSRSSSGWIFSSICVSGRVIRMPVDTNNIRKGSLKMLKAKCWMLGKLLQSCRVSGGGWGSSSMKKLLRPSKLGKTLWEKPTLHTRERLCLDHSGTRLQALGVRGVSMQLYWCYYLSFTSCSSSKEFKATCMVLPYVHTCFHNNNKTL